MTFACIAGTLATCGHPQTGSSKVFIDGKGVCRVGTDKAEGIISSPGSSKVFVEGNKVSLEGDLIVSHGDAPHNAPTTIAGQSKVNCGS